MRNDEAVADLVAFGAPQEVIDQMHQSTPEEEFPVLPENWLAVQVFMRCQTQWVYASTGRAIGLNYPGVDVVMRRMKVDDHSGEVFEAVQIIEMAALDALQD